MAVDDNMRIGDAEREHAVARLQDHLAAGRLSADEFNDRMGRALEARTAADLAGLFDDLPGGDPLYSPGPQHTDPYQPAPQYSPYDDPYGFGAPQTGGASLEPYGTPPGSGLEPSREFTPKVWYAQWWILLVAIFLSGVTNGVTWFLVPAAAIWIWVVYPNLQKRQPMQQVSAPPRPLTYLERDEVILALQSGGEVAAIRRYRELTGADLYTATMTVRAINRELGS